LAALGAVAAIFMAARAQVRERMKDVSVLQRRILSMEGAANNTYRKTMN
jgi:hypothetical protein